MQENGFGGCENVRSTPLIGYRIRLRHSKSERSERGSRLVVRGDFDSGARVESVLVLENRLTR